MRFQIEFQFIIYVVEVYIIAQMNLLLNLILLFVFLSLSIILNWVWLVSHRTVKFTGGLDFIGWTYLRPLYWSTCSANDHLLAAYVARYPYFPTLEISAQKRGITPQGWQMKWQTDKNLAQISNKINITSRPGKICVSAEKVRASLDFPSCNMKMSIWDKKANHVCICPTSL